MKRLAVVGGGPKGLAALVELDRALAGKASAPKIAVDIYEDSQPGSGIVWDTDTPLELIMNVPARIVDMSSPSFPQSYVRWALGHPNDLAREVYPPRAVMGQYLQDAFAAVAASPRFHVKHIRARVTAVEDAAATSTAWRVVASRDAQQEPQQFENSYDAVLLATGHHRPLPVSWYTDLQGSLSHNQGTSKHSQDTPNHVTIRGAALTAIDAVVCLTQGRGGTYAPHASRPGQLEYLPSGREPDTITLVSRTGLPLSPKPAALPAPLRQVIADATAPLVGLAHLSRTAPSAEWWDGLLAAGGQVADFLGLSTTPHSLRQVLFTPDRLRPNENAPQRMEQHLGMNRGDIAPDERWIWGRIWHSGYPNIIESLNRTPRDPEQWARFRTVAANAERWAYGPPEITVMRLLALSRTGRLRWKEGGSSQIHSPTVRDAVTHAPGIRNEHTGDVPDPLWNGLLAAGHVHVRAGERGVLTSPYAQCVSANGAPTPGLYAIGRPTEDPVIGHDTLNHHLHPDIQQWAQHLVDNSSEGTW